MNKRVGECSVCGNEALIYHRWRKPDQKCGPCYQRMKNKEYAQRATERAATKEKPKPIQRKPLKKKVSQKARKQILQDEIFYMEVWGSRKPQCEECGKPLGNLRDGNGKIKRWMFSHIISKGARPDLRHDKENINLLCMEHHHDWEFGDKKSMKIWEINMPYMERHVVIK